MVRGNKEVVDLWERLELHGLKARNKSKGFLLQMNRYFILL